MDEQSLRTDDCIEDVIQNYSNLVYRLAFAKTGTKYDADEIFQEVFLRYIKKKPKFKEEEHRKAWLIKVTLNCSKRFFNNSWRNHVQPLEDNIIFEEKETLDLYNELQHLPTKYREVIHLFYYENMSINEISSVLSRKQSTVRTQLTRAREMLKQFMKEEDYV